MLPFFGLLAAAAMALPWLLPFAPGPSPNVVPWLMTAAFTVAALLLVRPAALPRGLLALAAAVAAFVLLRPAGGTLDRYAFAGASALVLLAVAIGRGGDPAGRGMAPWIAGAWLAAALASALIGLLQYFGAGEHLRPWGYVAPVGEALANLRQRNQFASLTSIGLAALLWFAASPRPRLPLLVPAAIVLALANAATTSRTGALQWVVLAGLAAAWPGAARGRRLVLCGVGLASYAIAAWLLPMALQGLAGVGANSLVERLETDLGCSSRRVLWDNVLSLIAQRPGLGWGWGELDFAHFANLYGDTPRFCDILDNAHNLPLHLAVELGLPLALLACGLIVRAAWRARPWREADADRQLAWMALAALALHSMVEYPLWYGPFQVMLGLAVGLLLRRAPAAALSARSRAVAAALAMAALAYVGWDYARVSQVYLDPAQRLAPWREDTMAHALESRLFASHARFAELTLAPLTPDNARWMDAAAQSLLHYSPEPRVIERAIEAATMQERYDDAVLDLARYRAAFPESYQQWRAAQQRPIVVP